MNENDEKLLVQDIRSRFYESVTTLDVGTLSRIKRIRNRALNKLEDKDKNYNFWIPAGIFASISVAFLIYSSFSQNIVNNALYTQEIDILSEFSLQEEDVLKDLELFAKIEVDDKDWIGLDSFSQVSFEESFEMDEIEMYVFF